MDHTSGLNSVNTFSREIETGGDSSAPQRRPATNGPPCFRVAPGPVTEENEPNESIRRQVANDAVYLKRGRLGRVSARCPGRINGLAQGRRYGVAA